MNNTKSYERYQRQILLKEFGITAQEKLLQTKVLIIGAGGLGCPAFQYLVAAGVGTIGVVDDDVVSLTNLHRQVLYSANDIGLSKAEVAAHKLKELNNEINIIPYILRLTNVNALDIIDDYDIIIDGTDNFSSRYMINDACVLLKKTLVYGAVSKFEGQVAVFNMQSADERTINYRDLFPIPPKDDEVLNCAEAGVLGVLPGIIGTMQANETIKLITGIGKPLTNRLLTFNALNNSTYELSLSVNDEAQKLIPKTEQEFLDTDYEWLCASSNHELEISQSLFNKMMNERDTIIIDVREKDEQPTVFEFEHLQIPLSELAVKHSDITAENVIIFCQSGKRSLQAAQLLNEIFKNSKKVHSLKGGIIEWKKHYTVHAT